MISTTELISQLSEILAYTTETEMLNTLAELVELTNAKRTELNRENGAAAILAKRPIFHKGGGLIKHNEPAVRIGESDVTH